jgi:hypothetical protein
MIRHMKRLSIVIILMLTGSIFGQNTALPVTGEKRLQNIRQLTFGGENAEAYFSPNGKRGPDDLLVFSRGRQKSDLRLDLCGRPGLPAES